MTMSFVPDYLEYLQASGASPATIRARRTVLQDLHNHLPLGLAFASTAEIAGWLAQRGSTKGTKATYRHHVRAFYKWATETDLLDGDPSLGLSRVHVPARLPRPISDDEMAAILALPLQVGLRIAAVLAGFAGLRCCEISTCRREHVDESTLYVPAGKGEQAGYVPTHPIIWATVKDRPRGLLVLNKWGTTSPGWVSEAFRLAMIDAGMPGVTAHRLRHWFGTTVAVQTKDAFLTQQCLRHASPNSTAGYVRVAAMRLAAAVRDLPVPGTPAGA